MINSEKDLEDYICNNQKNFIKQLKETFDVEKDIKFIGRQVHIGERNIADLIYCYDTEEKIKDNEGNVIHISIIKNFIIVELKFRILKISDLSQISRYMTTLKDKVYNDEELCYQDIEVYGALVGFDLDDDMQEYELYQKKFIKNENDIKFITIKENIYYENTSYSRSKSYLQNLKLDERLMKKICE